MAHGRGDSVGWRGDGVLSFQLGGEEWTAFERQFGQIKGFKLLVVIFW